MTVGLFQMYLINFVLSIYTYDNFKSLLLRKKYQLSVEEFEEKLFQTFQIPTIPGRKNNIKNNRKETRPE